MSGVTQTDPRTYEYNREISKIHIALIEKRQETRFELLKNAVIGLFVYFAFCFGSESRVFVCDQSFVYLAVVPAAFLIFCTIYISTIQSSIDKHGGYIAYMYRMGLLGPELSINNFSNYASLYKYTGFERLYYHLMGERLVRHLHFSQFFLLMLAVCCIVLYLVLSLAGTFETACDFAKEAAVTAPPASK